MGCRHEDTALNIRLGLGEESLIQRRAQLWRGEDPSKGLTENRIPEDLTAWLYLEQGPKGSGSLTTNLWLGWSESKPKAFQVLTVVDKTTPAFVSVEGQVL
jgi:hypothetical protein